MPTFDLVTIRTDGTFDTGPVPISTSATYQRIGRVPLLNRVLTATVVVGPTSVAMLRTLRSSVFDDASPILIASAGGIVTVPAATFPLAANAVVQVSERSRPAEWIIEAGGAAAAGGWVRVYGLVLDPSVR